MTPASEGRTALADRDTSVPSARDITRIGTRGPRIFAYPPNATFGPRTLRDFEFVWLLTGSMSYTVRVPNGDNETHELRPGMLLLAQPGATDSYRWDADVVSRHAFIHFALGPEQTRWHGDWPRVHKLTDANPMGALCRYLERLAVQQPNGAEAKVREILGLLLHLFVTEATSAAGPSRLGNVHLERLVDWLATQWTDGPSRTVSVPQMAAAVGVSVGHLSRLCSSVLGVAPAAMVELLRLGRAALLLQRSNMTVGQVAAACGYVDAFHFSHRFRHAYGSSPRLFRSGGQDPLAPLDAAGLLPVAQRLLAQWD